MPDQLKLWSFALAAAIPVTFFIFIDHNVSSLLCQLPGLGLTRGGYYYFSGVICGITNIVAPLFGLPLITGALPDSPQMVRALQTPDGKVAENRFTPILMFSLIGLPLFVPQVLTYIPVACIDGVLVYAGIDGIIGTDLWARITHLLTSAADFPKALGNLKPWRIKLFTVIQFLWFASCWGVNLSPVGLLVAFNFVLILPWTRFVMPKIFSTEELAILNPRHGHESEVDLKKPSVKGLSKRSSIVSLHPARTTRQGFSVTKEVLHVGDKELVREVKIPSIHPASAYWSTTVPMGWRKREHRWRARCGTVRTEVPTKCSKKKLKLRPTASAPCPVEIRLKQKTNQTVYTTRH